MTDSTIRDSVQLQAIETWRASELERAQAQHVKQLRVTAENSRMVEQVQGEIGDSQSFVRAKLESTDLICTDSLTRIRHFSELKSKELERVTAVLDDSQQQLAVAKLKLQKKFEELSVIERLRARRTNLSRREEVRRQQLVLDDQAILREAQEVRSFTNLNRGK
jgi:hypothetical protein